MSECLNEAEVEVLLRAPPAAGHPPTPHHPPLASSSSSRASPSGRSSPPGPAPASSSGARSPARVELPPPAAEELPAGLPPASVALLLLLLLVVVLAGPEGLAGRASGSNLRPLLPALAPLLLPLLPTSLGPAPAAVGCAASVIEGCDAASADACTVAKEHGPAAGLASSALLAVAGGGGGLHQRGVHSLTGPIFASLMHLHAPGTQWEHLGSGFVEASQVLMVLNPARASAQRRRRIYI